ncbi:MAG TPA: hypothetical protein VGE30_02210, partial [Candidatus Saccharimonadales bacterium]
LMDHPTAENLQHDYRILTRIGALAIEGAEKTLTPIGRQLIDLPLDVSWARMVVEARNIGSAEGAEATAVHLQAAAAVSVQQVKGILNPEGKRRYLLSRRNQDRLSHESTSDLLFELDVFTRMYEKHQEILTSDEEDPEAKFEMFLRSKDVLTNRYYKALRTFEEVCRRERLDPLALRAATREERDQLVACQITGAAELFVKRGKFVYGDIRDDTQRRLGKRSTILHGAADLVIGSAFNRRGLRATGTFEKRFITGGSVVSREQILAHAPHRVTSRRIGYGVTGQGTLAEKRSLFFDGTLPFGNMQTELSPTIESREFILRAMMTGVAPRIDDPNETVAFSPFTPNATRTIRSVRRAQEIEDRSPAQLHVDERLEQLIKRVVKESVNLLPLDVTDIESLDAVIPPVHARTFIRPSRRKKIGTILATSPEGVEVELEEGVATNLPVFYKDNVAYVTIPRVASHALKREDFAAIEQYHFVKLRFGSGKYQRIDAVFEAIQRQQEKRQQKQARRAEIEAARASAAEHGTGDEAVRKTSRRTKKPRQSLPHLVAAPIKGAKRHHRTAKQSLKNKETRELVARA